MSSFTFALSPEPLTLISSVFGPPVEPLVEPLVDMVLGREGCFADVARRSRAAPRPPRKLGSPPRLG